MKKQFYIQDTTLNKYVYFNSVPEVVNYLTGMIQRATGLTRQQYTQNLMDLGYGPDDRDGVTFTRAMSDQFNIGIVNSSNTHVKTDIHTATNYLQEEYGDVTINRSEDRGHRI